jgi:hypothetical protein
MRGGQVTLLYIGLRFSFLFQTLTLESLTGIPKKFQNTYLGNPKLTSS